MMDRICSAVLDKIYSLASTGRYVVFSEDELAEAFPEGENFSDADLRKKLKELSAEGYIDIKYSSGDLYCIAPLKKYAQPPEIEPQIEKKQIKTEKSLYVFTAAMAGGALGSFIVSIIFALI